MGKLPAGKKNPPAPPARRGQNQDRSLLALAPPIAANLDDHENQNVGPKLAAAAAAVQKDDDTDMLTTRDKEAKKMAAATTSRGTVAANFATKEKLGKMDESKGSGKGDEEGGFLEAKQRISGGSTGRGNRKKKSSLTETFTPGAVLIPGINSGNVASYNNPMEDFDIDDFGDTKYDDDDDVNVDVDDAGTLIVTAQVVNNDEDDAKLDDEKIKEEVETRLKMHNENIAVVEAVVAANPPIEDTASKSPWNRKILGLTRKVWCLLVFLILLVVGIVTGVLVSSKSDSPAPIDLEALILETYENTSAFENPESPQSLALKWLLQDPFTLSQRNNGTAAKIYERYALAVFYYSMDGSNWIDVMQDKFLSANDTCSWNTGLIRRSDEEQGLKGAHCQSALAVDLLQFEDDGLSGTLPSELSLLTDLVFLNLTSDAIVGTIPTELGRLTVLQWLNFFNTSLSGTLPTEIGALTRLVKVSLGECNLEGSLPTELGSLTALTQLDVFDNFFNGTIPKELGGSTSLENFNGYKNDFVGSLPVELIQWTSLVLLDVKENRLTGTIPSELGSLTALEAIDVHTNLLTGTLPTELGLLTSLLYLDVARNSFNATLPTELGHLVNMTVFDITSNKFTGILPTELGNLTAMEWFGVSGNDLTGTLPTELGQWNSLVSFYTDENDLTGTLPTEFGAWNSVMYLSVYRNGLVGTVPTEFGRLGALVTLDISVNTLTGALPSELSQLSDLVQFSFYHNNLTGSVSDIFCLETREWDVLEGDCSINGSALGEIECSCCTACCSFNESACITG